MPEMRPQPLARLPAQQDEPGLRVGVQEESQSPRRHREVVRRLLSDEEPVIPVRVEFPAEQEVLRRGHVSLQTRLGRTVEVAGECERFAARSEERRVGNEGVRPCRSRWAACPSKTTTTKKEK